MVVRPMRLGGLFSGVGGFELAWAQLGGEVAWMCEVDKSARKVLAERFPGVPIYEDVRELDPADVPPVDVLTGGSPCQGFSIAGQRQGLLHGESRLFADYVRILDGLVPRGLRYALWENVPGVLSIKNEDGERTFPHVLGALAGAGEPVRLDPKRKWTSGLVAGRGRGVAYRILDSRYFGVAQRRRRIFACVAVGDSGPDRAGRALLAVAEGLRWDSAAGVAARQAAAGGPRGGSTADGSGDGVRGGELFVKRSHSEYADDTVGSALLARHHKDSGDLVVPPAVLMTMREGRPGGGKGPLLSEEESLTLATGNGQTLFQPFRTTHAVVVPETTGPLTTGGVESPRGTETSDSSFVVPDVAHTLTGEGHDAGEDGTGRGTPILPDRAFNWQQGHAEYSLREDASAVTADSRPAVLTAGVAYDGYNAKLEVGVHRSLRTGADSGDFVADESTVEYGVRRLTPVECERLQAFPDGWTEPAASDSARYKALGNAVTVNTVRWILARIVDVEVGG